jgi:hypothetical protein
MKKERRVLVTGPRIKNKVKGGENTFSIDPKGGEYRERGEFIEREMCKGAPK